MTKKPSHRGSAWNRASYAQLRQLANQNTPTRVIGLKMGRTPEAWARRALLD